MATSRAKLRNFRELNGGNYSAQEPVEQEPEPLTPREIRRKSYWKLLHGESRLDPTAVGDGGKAIGALQIHADFFQDTHEWAEEKGRSFPAMQYEDLSKHMHAGASAFAENQRRNNPTGWESGDERSILLAHHWGADWEKKAENDPEEAAKYIKDMAERLPEDKKADDYWRLPKPPSRPPPTQLDPEQEREFLFWYDWIRRVKGWHSGPDDPEHNYDYRAFYKNDPEEAKKLLEEAHENPDVHFPSEFKLKEHERYYIWDKENQQLLETATGKTAVDYWEYLTTQALDPKRAAGLSSRNRPEGKGLWRWPERQPKANE